MSDSDSGAAVPVQPRVVRTYGGNKLGEQLSSSSELTSLSQLSAHTAKMNDSGFFPAPLAAANPQAVSEPSSSPVVEHKQTSLVDQLARIDAEFDALDDDGDAPVPAPVKLFTSTPTDAVTAAAAGDLSEEHQPADAPASSSSSLPAPRLQRSIRSSTPAELNGARHQERHEDEDEESAPMHVVRKAGKSSSGLPKRQKYDTAIRSSSDVEEEAGAGADPRRSESRKQDRLFLSSDAEDEQAVRSKTPEKKQKPLLAALSDDDESDAEQHRDTSQKTEEIESFADDSQLQQQKSIQHELGWNEPRLERSESPEAGKEKTRKPRAPSKKDLDAIHALEAAQRRQQAVGIASGTRATRPLSHFLNNLNKGRATSASAATARGSSSARPSATTNNAKRGGSVGRPLLEMGRPAATAKVPASARGSKVTATAIEIGSSSAILDADAFDQDSYDAGFLHSQSETVPPRRPVPAAAKKEPSPIQEEEDSDEELPDIAEEMAKDARRRALKAKKAAAVSAARVRAEESSARRREAHETVPDYRIRAKGKSIAMDVDTDEGEEETSDLEIVLPKKEAPAIVASATAAPKHQHRAASHGGQARGSTPDVSDSQIARAGRTFGRTGALVDAHVAVSSRPAFGQQHGAGWRKAAAISGKQLNAHLLMHAGRQGQRAVWERKEDWKKRGGTFREDDSRAAAAPELGPAQEEGVIERMQKKAAEDGGNSDDDEEDGDYVGSADEQQEEAEVRSVDMHMEEGSDAERGSGSEAGAEDEDERGSADEDEEVETQEPPPAAQRPSAFLDEDEDQQRTAETERVGSQSDNTGQETPSRRALYTTSAEDLQPLPSVGDVPMDLDDEEEEEEAAIFRRPLAKVRTAAAVLDDDDEETIQPRLAKRDGVIDPQAERPDFEAITDADFALPAGTGSPALDDIGDLFEGFSQTQLATQTQTQAGGLPASQRPEMFRKLDALAGAVQTPQLKRHAVGAAPLRADAAQKDADLAGQHEDAFYEARLLQQQAEAAAAAAAAAAMTTPGSALSEELPPLPIITDLVMDRYEHRLPADTDDDDEQTGPTSEQTQEASPSELPRRKLRRAGEDSPQQQQRADPTLGGGPLLSFSDSSDDDEEASPVAMRKEGAKKPKSAFDALAQGALDAHLGVKPHKEKKKRAANEFVAEQADESEEEEGRFGSLFKSAPEAGEDENAADDEDLDAVLTELVDDEKVDAALQEEQDARAQDRFMQDQAADDAKQLKMAQKVAAGEAKKRKRGQGELSDSDYEDDEGMYRKAKERKPVKFNDRVEAIAANAEYAAFGQSMKDTGHGRQEDNIAFLEDGASGQPASEMDGDADEEDEYDTDIEGESLRRGKHGHARERSQQRNRTPSDQLVEIQNMLQSSPGLAAQPRIKPRIASLFTKVAASVHGITARSSVSVSAISTEFDDIDAQYSYTESQVHVRKQIFLDKEESQTNDRGIGPGRTSAVTSFVQKKGAKAHPGPGASGGGSQLSRSNSSLSHKSAGSFQSGAGGGGSQLSRSSSNASGVGRLAKARQMQGKR